MDDTRQYLLQLSDSLLERRCILRIEKKDTLLPLKHLLEKYLKNPPVDRLLEEGRVTQGSLEVLSDIQEFVYMTADDGRLGDIFAGIIFKQGRLPIDLNSTPFLVQALVKDTTILVMDVHIDRTNAGYDRNWVGFHRRRWLRHQNIYSDFVMFTLEQECGRKEAQDILELSSTDQKTRLVRVLAKRIWDSDFESYSRFTGRKLAHKTGDETVRNIMDAAGGICAEKVEALKFITDHFGISSEYLFAGVDARGQIPEEKLRELLDTFDFRFSKRYMRYWQHTALLYHINGTSVLVDATNGNIPFLFLTDGAAERLLSPEDKRPVQIKMVDSYEDFYYHRVSQDIAEDFFFAMETWIEHMDMIQVFENELGLYLSKGFYVTPIVFKDSRDLDKLKHEYIKICNDAGLAYSISDDWNLDSSVGERFAKDAPQASQKVILSKEHLLKRYDEWDGQGHEANLLVVQLSN